MRPAYPTQTTTTTTTTPKSSFFGGIRNYFRKTPTTLAPEIAPTKVTPQQPKPGQVTPVLPSIPVTPKPNQNVRDFVAPVTSTTTKPKENFPGLPPVQPNPKPNPNIRDYVAPAPTTKKTTIKEDFPALPTSRGGTPTQQPTSTIPSAWGSTKSTNGVTTPAVQFVPRPTTVPKAPVPVPQLPQSGGVKDQDNELTELTELLLTKDTNNAYKYVKVNYQGKTQSFSSSDEASEK